MLPGRICLKHNVLKTPWLAGCLRSSVDHKNPVMDASPSHTNHICYKVTVMSDKLYILSNMLSQTTVSNVYSRRIKMRKAWFQASLQEIGMDAAGKDLSVTQRVEMTSIKPLGWPSENISIERESKRERGSIRSVCWKRAIPNASVDLYTASFFFFIFKRLEI